MDKKTYISSLVGLSLIAIQGVAHSHTLKTKTGKNVSHAHMTTKCPDGSVKGGNGYCGQADATWEATMVRQGATGFTSSNRKAAHTGLWNCHGRTFDARRSWVGSADPWLIYDGPYTPSTPKPGDAIVWIQNNTTTHSVTIVGPWAGVNTIVRSKYGTQGEYQHALFNTLITYPGNAYVTRFGAGTPIYTIAPEKGVMYNTDATGKTLESKFLEASKDMPWYKDLSKAKSLVSKYHSKLVNNAGSFLPETKVVLNNANNTISEKIDALIKDLLSNNHYELYGAYDHPSYVKDFIGAIQSGQKLVQLSENNESKGIVIEKLKNTILDINAEYINSEIRDEAKGATLFFMKKIMNNSEFNDFKTIYFSLKKKSTQLDENNVPSYVKYYMEN